MPNRKTQPSKQEFVAAVERSFDYLVRDYGFRREPVPPGERDVWIAYDNDKSRARVVIEGTDWGLNTRVAIGRSYNQFENFDLSDLIAMRGSGGHDAPDRGTVKSGSTQLEQVRYYADVLRSIGEDILRGNFDVFPDLAARVHARQVKFKKRNTLT